MAGGAFVALGLVSTYSFLVFETVLPAAGYAVDELGTWARDPALLGESVAYGLASRQRGLFIYSPFLILLLPFCVRAWRISPGWVRAAAVGAVAYAIFQAVATTFVGGDHFFSYRVQLESLALMAPLLVMCWASGIRTDHWLKWPFGAFAISAVAIHAVGVSLLTIDPDVAADYREGAEERRMEVLDSLRESEGA